MPLVSLLSKKMLFFSVEKKLLNRERPQKFSLMHELTQQMLLKGVTTEVAKLQDQLNLRQSPSSGEIWN